MLLLVEIYRFNRFSFVLEIKRQSHVTNKSKTKQITSLERNISHAKNKNNNNNTSVNHSTTHAALIESLHLCSILFFFITTHSSSFIEWNAVKKTKTKQNEAFCRL